MSGNSAHKRQLFHWLGKDIEQDTSLSPDDKIERYLKYLAYSLKNGLRLTRQTERFYHAGLKADGFMVCFTDNRLSDCVYHSRSFGKMGLGFSKKFVLNHYGKPVIYCRNNRFDEFGKAFARLVARYPTDAEFQARLRYLMAFLKPLGKQTKRAKPSPTRVVRRPTARTALMRQYGPKLHYYVESEWRIVFTDPLANKARFSRKNNLYLLPYSIGRDLFTIVFPNLRTQSEALQDPNTYEASSCQETKIF